jgi:hypothetical protein
MSQFGKLNSGGIYEGLMTGMYALTGGSGFRSDHSKFNWNSLVITPEDLGGMIGSKLGGMITNRIHSDDSDSMKPQATSGERGRPVDKRPYDPLPEGTEENLGAYYYSKRRGDEDRTRAFENYAGGDEELPTAVLAPAIANGNGADNRNIWDVNDSLVRSGQNGAGYTDQLSANMPAVVRALNETLGSNYTSAAKANVALQNMTEGQYANFIGSMTQNMTDRQLNNFDTILTAARGLRSGTVGIAGNQYVDMNSGQSIAGMWNGGVVGVRHVDSSSVVNRQYQYGNMIGYSEERTGLWAMGDWLNTRGPILNGLQNAGEYLGNNRAAGLTACFGGALFGGLVLPAATVTAPVWGPAVFGRTATDVMVNSTIGAINTTSYLLTSDNPTFGGAATSFSEAYGLARIGTILAGVPRLQTLERVGAGTGIGAITDYVVQNIQIAAGSQSSIDNYRLLGSSLFTGLGQLPYQVFNATGSIVDDFWPNIVPRINTTAWSTMVMSTMQWWNENFNRNDNPARNKR